MSLPPPLKVSSLIKVTRWSLLSAGIFYGVTRHRTLAEKERIIREKREAERPAREAAAKIEKERKYKEDMEYLGRETGIIPGGPLPAKKEGEGGESGGPLPPPSGSGGGGSGAPVPPAKSSEAYKSECGCQY